MLIHVTIVALLVVIRGLLSRRAWAETERGKSQIKVIEQTAIVWCIIFLLVQPLLLQPFVVSNRSMTPSLHPGDTVLISKSSYWLGAPRRWDVVVFKPKSDQIAESRLSIDVHSEANAGTKGEDLFYVKRVAGLPGEVVEAVNGKLFVNGMVMDLPSNAGPIPYDLAPVVVPEDSIFVLGDNCRESWDSHNWGPLPLKSVIGRVVAELWPPSRFGFAR